MSESIESRMGAMQAILTRVEATQKEQGQTLSRIDKQLVAQEARRSGFGTLWENVRTLVASSGAAAIVAWWLRSA